MVVLGLHWRTRALSGCGERGPFPAARRLLTALASLAGGRGSGVCGPRHLGTGAQELQLPASVAPHLVGSSPTTDGTHVPCLVRQTLNQCLAMLEAIQMVHIMVYFISSPFPFQFLDIFISKVLVVSYVGARPIPSLSNSSPLLYNT